MSNRVFSYMTKKMDTTKKLETLHQVMAIGKKSVRVTILQYIPHTTYNERARDSGGKYTYAYEVLINGESRAAFTPEYNGRGYWFVDADGRQLKRKRIHTWEASHSRKAGERVVWDSIKADARGNFFKIVRDALQDKLIPTFKQMGTLRHKEAADRYKKAVTTWESDRAELIRDHAQQMHDTLMNIAASDTSGGVHIRTLARKSLLKIEFPTKPMPDDFPVKGGDETQAAALEELADGA